LGITKFLTGQIPSYRDITQFCTCAIKKSTLLRISNYKGNVKLTQAAMESCPVNLLYAILSRQTGTRVSPDKKVLRRFSQFAKKANKEIIA
jgi:hypothetical protein